MNLRQQPEASQGPEGPVEHVPNVRPIVDEGLGNSSYLVEVAEGRALVVDPSRDPSPYLRAAAAWDLEIAWVAETHLHADFVSGAHELARTGATVLAAREAELAFTHRGLEDGKEVDLGGLALRALATPGHTPEHLSLLLLDGAAPVGVFTGGALLPGAVARTDLIAADQTEPLARALYRSIRERFTLPDATPVYPTHGAGSFCSAPSGGERITTIGRERETNPLLSSPDEDTFVRDLLGSFGTYPTYFRRLRAVNRRGPALYGSDPPPLAAPSSPTRSVGCSPTVRSSSMPDPSITSRPATSRGLSPSSSGRRSLRGWGGWCRSTARSSSC